MCREGGRRSESGARKAKWQSERSGLAGVRKERVREEGYVRCLLWRCPARVSGLQSWERGAWARRMMRCISAQEIEQQKIMGERGCRGAGRACY